MSVRQRLTPTREQVAGLMMHAAHARFVWNLGLEQRNLHIQARRRGRTAPLVSAASQMRELAQARRATPWLAAGSSSVQQGALRDLDRALRNWWSNPGHFRRPRWRKAGIDEGFYVRDLHVRPVNHRHAQALVPKVGWVKFRLTRPLGAAQTATSARITYQAGRWHVSFTTGAPPFERTPTGTVVGIDRGVANTLATSDGAMHHVPSLTPGEQTRFLALQRRLSRQRPGSARRARTRAQLARLHQRIADRRRDFVEQTTTAMVRGHDLIAIEALNTTAMVRRPRPRPDRDTPGVFQPNRARAKAALNKAIHASAWGAFARRLADKATHTPDHARTIVVVVDPRNTSRQCRACGHIAAENRESQAVFACVACGHRAHADTNAAENILDRALTTLPGQGYAAGRAVNGRTSPTTPVGRVNHPEPVAA